MHTHTHKETHMYTYTNKSPIADSNPHKKQQQLSPLRVSPPTPCLALSCPTPPAHPHPCFLLILILFMQQTAIHWSLHTHTWWGNQYTCLFPWLVLNRQQLSDDGVHIHIWFVHHLDQGVCTKSIHYYIIFLLYCLSNLETLQTKEKCQINSVLILAIWHNILCI